MIGLSEISKNISEVCKTSMDMPKFGEGIKADTISSFSKADKPLANQERARILPKEDGNWEGERGNSEFKLDLEKVPQKSNPERKTWKEIFEDKIPEIIFKDGEPDFTPFAESTVEIGDFSENRGKNFKQADIQEAKKRGCSPQEVKQWREENGYTWHERSDCKTMDLVPSIIHNNISHSGGISEIKKRNGEN